MKSTGKEYQETAKKIRSECVAISSQQYTDEYGTNCIAVKYGPEKGPGNRDGADVHYIVRSIIGVGKVVSITVFDQGVHQL